MLPNDEILRRLRTIKHSSLSSRQNGNPSISRVAQYAGLTRAAIYLMFQTGSTGRSQARLSHALQHCQDEQRVRSSVSHP